MTAFIVGFAVIGLLLSILAFTADTFHRQRLYVSGLVILLVAVVVISGVFARAVVSQSTNAFYLEGASAMFEALNALQLIAVGIGLAIYICYLFRRRN